jgi:glyoxylate/hydroxypyruvate reductase A
VRVLLCTPSPTLPEWRDAFARALPQGEVRAWEPGLAWRADYAALWYPAAEVLADQNRLKAIFNLGAGVEALLERIALPPGVPVVRLEDAGMARQMAEYVTWAVLRYFRGLDAYAAQQSRAEWNPHRPRRHADFPVGVMGVGVLGTHVARGVAALGFPVLGWKRSGWTACGASRANRSWVRFSAARARSSACCRSRRRPRESSTAKRSASSAQGAT